jgi:hypothetical protein
MVYLSCDLPAESRLTSVFGGIAMDGGIPLRPDFEEESPYYGDHRRDPSDSCVLWIYAANLWKVLIL